MGDFKKTFFVCLLFFINFSCSTSPKKEQKTIPVIPKITIDTLQRGVPGDKDYSFLITKKVGTLLTERHERFYWEGPSIQDVYYDGFTLYRFAHTDYPNTTPKGRRISYTWLDKKDNLILAVDTVYKKGMVVEVEHRTSGFNFINYYKNKRKIKTRITDMGLGMEYLKKDGTYTEVDITVLLQYTERVYSTRSTFGRAHFRFLESLLSAGSEIEQKYLLIARKNHGFDLIKTLKDFQKEAVFGSDN